MRNPSLLLEHLAQTFLLLQSRVELLHMLLHLLVFCFCLHDLQVVIYDLHLLSHAIGPVGVACAQCISQGLLLRRERRDVAVVGGCSLLGAYDIGFQLWVVNLHLLFHSIFQYLKFQVQLLIDLSFLPE